MSARTPSAAHHLCRAALPHMIGAGGGATAALVAFLAYLCGSVVEITGAQAAG